MSPQGFSQILVQELVNGVIFLTASSEERAADFVAEKEDFRLQLYDIVLAGNQEEEQSEGLYVHDTFAAYKVLTKMSKVEYQEGYSSTFYDDPCCIDMSIR